MFSNAATLLLAAALVVSLNIVSTATAGAAEPLGLEDCYRLALARSEVLATQAELITQAEERYGQASGALFPTLNAVGTYQRLDKPPGTETAFTRTERPEVKLAASQPLFRGFREYAAIRQRRDESEAAVQARAQAGSQLYLDVAQAFFNVLSLEQDLRDLSAEIELGKKRAGELAARKRIGRSRLSEELTVQATVAGLEAQGSALRSQVLVARELLAFLTGASAGVALGDDGAIPGHAAPLERYLERVDLRPDVRAAERQFSASEEGVVIARGGHLPSIDVAGNYYLKRVGVLQDQKWDVTLTGTLPIFAGGTVQSGLREAVSRRRQAELAVSSARRQAEEGVRSLHRTVEGGHEQLEALRKAAELAERNYAEQSREYRYGLVTNIDVLQSLTTFQETRRAHDRAKFALKLDFVRLETAAALLPSEVAADGRN